MAVATAREAPLGAVLHLAGRQHEAADDAGPRRY